MAFIRGMLSSVVLFVLFQVLLESKKIKQNNGRECYQEQDQRPQHKSTRPPEALLQQARERSQHIADFRPSTADILLGRLNQNLFNGLGVSPLWKISHFPDINIVGLPKAGTSHLYQVLIGHPSFAPFNRAKEFCFAYNKTYYFKLSALYHQINITSNNYSPLVDRAIDMLQKANAEGDWNSNHHQRTVNGCIGHIENVFLQRQYLQRNNAKFILLFRDPADWTWAAYNFWFWKLIDSTPSSPQNTWTSAAFHHRSPELFHEYMLAGERSVEFKAFMNILRDDLASWLTALVAEVIDKDNLLVLKVEDIAPDAVLTSGAMEKLSKFLGVDSAGFNPDIVNSYGNCGDTRGESSTCKSASNAYEIAGGRRMSEETRELVYIHFSQECKYWAEKFDVFYAACLEVGAKYVISRDND